MMNRLNLGRNRSMYRKNMFLGLLAATAAAALVACSQTAQSPVAPSAVADTSSALNADGSSLKATAPSGLAPNGATVDSLKPALSFAGSQGRFAAAAFTYEVELSTQGGEVVFNRALGGSTSLDLDIDLQYETDYRWRARAMMGSDAGPWSEYATFRTLDKPKGGLGNGPRTPNPPRGQRLPVPDYGLDVVLETAAMYPQELRRACKDDHRWLFHLVENLRKRDSRWGLNWKRGDQNQGMSSDVVSYNPSEDEDEGNGAVYIFDVLRAECEENTPGFSNITAATWAAAGNPLCGHDTYCVKWTLQPYLAAGHKP
jgi:hypothetical protein